MGIIIIPMQDGLRSGQSAPPIHRIFPVCREKTDRAFDTNSYIKIRFALTLIRLGLRYLITVKGNE